MLIPPRIMQDLIAAIVESKTLPELKAIMAVLPLKSGLQHAVYHYLGTPAKPLLDIPGFATYPDEWVNRYLENGYVQVDPVVRRGLRSILPFEWSELTIDTPEQKKLFTEAQEFDLGKAALSLPVRGLGGENALFTITSEAPDTFSGPQRVNYVRDYQVLGVYVHESFARLNKLIPEQTMELSRRETQCLKLASEGLLGKEIAHRLKLSEPAVRLYLRIARHKLGASSTSGAVALGVRRGLI